jgi:hypothetical protein
MTAKLKLVASRPSEKTDCVRANRLRAMPAHAGRSAALRAEPTALSQAKPAAAIAKVFGSPRFIGIGRNTELESPTRFVATVKGPDDVVI